MIILLSSKTHFCHFICCISYQPQIHTPIQYEYQIAPTPPDQNNPDYLRCLSAKVRNALATVCHASRNSFARSAVFAISLSVVLIAPLTFSRISRNLFLIPKNPDTLYNAALPFSFASSTILLISRPLIIHAYKLLVHHIQKFSFH